MGQDGQNLISQRRLSNEPLSNLRYSFTEKSIQLFGNQKYDIKLLSKKSYKNQ